MSSSIQNQITNMQSYTNMMKAAETAANGASSELDQDAFLLLMMEQLKYQDPLEPVGNTEFLAQQAAFTQVSELQKLNDALNTSSQVTQACTLMGKNVTLLNPDDTSQTIEGEVTAVTFTGGAAQIVVNGKEYPLGLVMGISETSSTTGSDESTNNTNENNTNTTT